MPDLATRSDLQTESLRRRMKQFFDATTDAIVFLDRVYSFTYLNRRANEVISMGQDLCGRNLYEVFPDAVYEGLPYIDGLGLWVSKGIDHRRSTLNLRSSQSPAHRGTAFNLFLPFDAVVR